MLYNYICIKTETELKNTLAISEFIAFQIAFLVFLAYRGTVKDYMQLCNYIILLKLLKYIQ